MNFFEKELQKIVNLGVPITDQKYVGSACYGRLDDMTLSCRNFCGPVCLPIEARKRLLKRYKRLAVSNGKRKEYRTVFQSFGVPLEERMGA